MTSFEAPLAVLVPHSRNEAGCYRLELTLAVREEFFRRSLLYLNVSD